MNTYSMNPDMKGSLGQQLVIWAGIEGVIRHAQMAGLLELGRAIAGALPGSTLDEKLRFFEGGIDNRTEVAFDGGNGGIKGRVTLLRADIFDSTNCCTLPWSRNTLDLLKRYNESMPGGGGAIHPLHIVQHEVHRRLGQIVDLGAREGTTGETALSARGLERVGMTAEQAQQLLAGGAILYSILDS